MSEPEAALRRFFEALLTGCAVVAEADEAAARELLTGVARSLDGPASAIKRALLGEAPSQEPWGEPYFVGTLPKSGGEMRLYRPEGSRR